MSSPKRSSSVAGPSPAPGARVLLCMHGDAAEIPAVSRALEERGAVPLLLDTARFPTGERLSLEWVPDGRFTARRGDGDPLDVAAVWQGVVAGRDLPAMDAGSRRTCVGASEMALLGMLDATRAFQLDPVWLRARAENKPAQLRAAQEAALDVPATVVTNDPAAVRALAARAPRLVTKMLIQPIAEGGDETVVFTTELDPGDLERLDGLELCPMIFQERVDSALDVRVTIAGRVVHAAAIGPAGRLGTDVDWRRDSHDQERTAAWAPHDLPRPIAEGLVAVLDHYGLEYGAFDLVVAPDGRHVFLELNPAGSFSFLGAAHEAAIAGAIADLLVDRSARRLERRA